ncbi:MAG: FAD-dependent oxidoreductase, partial [Deltaproteobacteria bacterium]|nr:FAD-dependent oxidoreductase [Deltaproteobacteria bacterium]
ILDNVSIYERLEDESRAWADRRGGSVVELHAYAIDPRRSEKSVREELLSALHALYPETRKAQIIEERFLWRADCPAFRPGDHKKRPSVKSSNPHLYFAGDFVRLPFPSALMERAVSSGAIAGNAIAAKFGRTPEPLLHLPERGILAQAAKKLTWLWN